jgi:hypothetical protein
MPAAQKRYDYDNLTHVPESLRVEALKILHAADPVPGSTTASSSSHRFFQTHLQQAPRASLRLAHTEMEPRPTSGRSVDAEMSYQQRRIDDATAHRLTPAQVEQDRLLLLADAQRSEFAARFHKKPQPVQGLAPDFIA